MKTKPNVISLLPLLSVALYAAQFFAVHAQGTAFTYQGRLNVANFPANGSYDLTFTLYNTNSGGVVLAGPVTNSATTVSNGLFTTTIDFGAQAFNGSGAWLEVAVRTNGSGAFGALLPYEQITPTPYAITAQNLAGVVLNNMINGTGDTIGGGNNNSSSGSESTVGGGQANTASLNWATVGGGHNNTSSGQRATVGGGEGNISGNDTTTVAGGRFNNSSGTTATVGGGNGNISSGDFATVCGGDHNTASGFYAAVPGGNLNLAAGYYSFAAGHRAKANHQGSFVWADSQDVDFTSTANDQFSLRARNGVRLNTDTSLFWGSGAKLWPDQGGAIELGDSLAASSVPYVDFHYGVSSSQDFNVRLMNDADGQLTLYGNQQITGNLSFGAGIRQMINLYPGNLHAIGVQNSTTYFRSSSRFSWFQNGVHANGENDPGTGGVVLMTLTSSGLTVNGTVVSSSDRNVKENFKPISTQEILQKVANLPLTRWNYKEDKASEHIGPMAQDFYAAFNVGPDDKHIAVVDEGGVAFAAIQGLNQKLEETRAENAELKHELADIKQMLAQLTQRKN
jgi:trimeric autotransporter adhesin